MSWVRRAAAGAWLWLLFRLTLHAPNVLRLLKPFFVRGAWVFSASIRRGTMANAARLLGPGSRVDARKTMGRAVVANFYEAVLDFGRNRQRTMEETLATIGRVEGLEHYERARAMKRGAILVTAHLGPFETAVASVRSRESRVHVLFQRDPSPTFERLRAEQRARLGVIEAPVDDGLATWFALRDALRADEVVLMQGDRTMPGQRGVVVPFLDGYAEIPNGPARLAMISGAPIIPTFAVRVPGEVEREVAIFIGEPMLVGTSGPPEISPAEATARIAAAVSGVILRYPEQWLALSAACIEDLEPGTP